MEFSVWEGIIVGAAGGAGAALAASFVMWVVGCIRSSCHQTRIYNWLKDEREKGGDKYRSTRAIASWTNLHEDRVRFLCSQNKKIHLSTGPKEDLWGIDERESNLEARQALHLRRSRANKREVE